jgi:glucose/mannose-6-phosphate isomerase
MLDQLTERYKPAKDSFLNPAKGLAIAFAAPLPVVWGTSPLAGVAAYRAACQLNENAKRAAVWGVVPEANHNQVVPFDDPDAADGVRLLFLRDSVEHPDVARRVAAAQEMARERGIGFDEVVAEGEPPVARLASLVAAVDFATVYLALLRGLDPTVIAPIVELKRRLAE